MPRLNLCSFLSFISYAIIFLFWSFSSLSFADGVKYSWIQDPHKKLKGECYQVDAETMGSSYKVRVKKENCKPSKTDFIFYPSIGQCYEVDAKTQGKAYIKRVNAEQCNPGKTETGIFKFNDKVGCYKVDIQTKGQKFYKKQSLKDCATKKVKATYWQYISEGKGKCYQGFISQGQELKVLTDEENCKTDNTHFYFIRKNEISGKCIEEDKESPKSYSYKVKVENCRPKDTIFVFYTSPGKKRGHCYEIDTETKGDKYINVVESENCLPDK